MRPVYWRAGTKGAPSADDAKPVRGSAGTYSGSLWLMAGGSYSVHVTVLGSAGQGTLIVPVAAVATGQLQLSSGLRWLLIALGTLLVAGVITAVHAAVGESQVPPGEPVPPARRRRARIGAAIATPIMALLIFGGARWWDAEATAYRQHPLPADAHVERRCATPPACRRSRCASSTPAGAKGASARSCRTTARCRTCSLPGSTRSACWRICIPRSSIDATLVTALPPLPAGRYRLYADVVHETGFQRTLVDSIALAAPLAPAGVSALDVDDAWFEGPTAALPAMRDVQLGDVAISWAGDTMPVSGRSRERFASHCAG